MVNIAYINKIQSIQTQEKIDNLYASRAKNYQNKANPDFNYKRSSWDELDIRNIDSIINMESESTRLDSEFKRIVDTAENLNIVIDILDGIQKIVTEVRKQIVYDKNYNKILNLDTLKETAYSALKIITSLCNKRSNNGDYVMSGNAVEKKPFEKNSIDYRGGTSNFMLILNGENIGELEVRADNQAIKDTLESLQKLAFGKNNSEIGKILDNAFIDIINLKQNTAALYQKTLLFQDRYQLENDNIIKNHFKISSNNDVEYAEELRRKEEEYNLSLEITNKFLKSFERNRDL